jgi:hypothetical protein
LTLSRQLAFVALILLVSSAGFSSATGATSSPGSSGTLAPYLRPASKIEVTRCEDAARSVNLDVLCPLVMPKGQYDNPWCEGGKATACGYPCVFGACFLAQIVYAAPRGYVGMASGIGHFVVWATTQGRRVIVPCLIGRKVSSVENGGRKWGIWHCGEQSANDPGIQHRDGRTIIDGGEVMQGHIVFVTIVKNTNVEVSLHRVSALNRMLLMRITADMAPSK